MALRDAELYQCLHRGNPGDTDHYCSSCHGARSILELGSGYGRVAFTLAERGHAVTGLELDSGLLQLARAELEARPDLAGRVRLLLGDMRGFELEEQFDRVIIPYSGLYCLLSPQAVDSCLKASFRHLTPGGALCLDVYFADAFHSDSEPEEVAPDELEPVVSVVHDGDVLSIHERSAWDKSAQRVDVHYEYRNGAGRLVHTASVEQRYLLLEQLTEHVRAAGFVNCEVYADFSRSAPTADTDTVALIAHKP